MRYIFAFIFFWAQTVLGQKTEHKITFHAQGKVLSEVLAEFTTETGYHFSYSDDVIPADAVVTAHIVGQNIENALKQLFEGLPIEFRLNGTRVLLRAKSVPLFQTVRGTVKEKGLTVPLPGATIILVGSNPLIGTTTNEDGSFIMEQVPIGRATFRISSLGFEALTISDVAITSGKEIILDISLQESAVQMDEIEVVANRNEIHAMGFPTEGREFSVEETKRFPAVFADPARMATSFAGVSVSSDEGNGLSIRGNSPRGLLWRINGIEVPNPNHFASEGSSNGVISILSANVLGPSRFMKGPFSAAVGNALSGVLDLSLRQGNDLKKEHSIQAGSLGLEASTEGPFIKGRSAYLVNYRYSTLRLLDHLGVSLAEVGKYSNYHDFTINANSQIRGGNVNVFAIGGKSNSEKVIAGGLDRDASDVGVGGVVVDKRLNDRIEVKTSLSWSGTRISNDREVVPEEGLMLRLTESYRKNFYKSSVEGRMQMSKALYMHMGVIHTMLKYDFYLRNIDPGNTSYDDILNFDDKGRTSFTQSFLAAEHRLSPALTATYGLHYMAFRLTGDKSLEPRIALHWKTGYNSSLSFMVGKHSRIENLQYYIARDHQEGGNEVQVNRDLGFTRSNHYGISYQKLLKRWGLTGEAYIQQLSNVPVYMDNSAFYSAINEVSGFVTDTLYNRGTGKNYGFEVSIDRKWHQGLYLFTALSLYESKLGVSETLTNTAFNGNYIIQFTGGKEKKTRNNNVIGLNVKMSLAGGRPYIPIDIEKSRSEGFQVMDWSRAYSDRLPKYFRADLQIMYRINRRRTSSEWRIDIQNVTDHRNASYYFYDVNSKEIRLRRQVGFIPLLTYRIDF